MNGKLGKVLLFILSAVTYSGVCAEPITHFTYYVYAHQRSEKDIDRIKRIVRGVGGFIAHELSDSEFIVLSKRQLSLDQTLSQFNVSVFSRTERSGQNQAIGGAQQTDSVRYKGIRIWRVFADADKQPRSTTQLDTKKAIATIQNLRQGDKEATASSSQDPIYSEITSRYMVGSIAVGVVLMESQSGLYDWNQYQIDTAIAWIILELNAISIEALKHDVHLAWKYEITTNVATAYEPINTNFPDGDNLGWIDDALGYFGMSNGWAGTMQLAGHWRTLKKTNWGVTIFVAMNMPGFQKFPNGNKAYVPAHYYSFGPFQQLFAAPFLEVGYSYITGAITQHEMSHVFGAVDEYHGGPGCTSESNTCSVNYGYLHEINGNCTYCSQQFPCVMFDRVTRQYCHYSRTHLGWRDSDGDGPPDSIDPNSDRWMSIFPVTPGDVVVISKLTGDIVNSFAVTESNSNGTVTIWDGHNFDNVQAAPGIYYVSVNGGAPFVAQLHVGDLSVKPIFTAGAFSHTDSIQFRLTNSFAFVRIRIIDSTNEIYGTPVVDQLHPASATIKKYDLSYLPNGSYTATFQGWRPDGGLSDPYSISFIQYTCGDINNDSKVNIGDATQLLAHIFSGAQIPDPIERADANGDGSLNIGDSSYMMARIFGSGPAPVCSGFQN